MFKPGVKLAVLYGIYPFLLGLCGPKEKENKGVLLDYLLGKEVPEKNVESILRQFKGAFPYYEEIAQSNNIKDPFDERVVRAYWTGNDFLEKAGNKHHSYHVFVAGPVDEKIKLEGKLLDICRVSWGEVIKVIGDKVVVKYQPINNYSLGEFVEKQVFWDKRLIPEVKIRDKVSMHWNHIIEVLDEQDLANLEKYTKITLESLKQ